MAAEGAYLGKAAPGSTVKMSKVEKLSHAEFEVFLQEIYYPFTKRLGQSIREARESRGLSREDLAAATHSHTTLRRA